MDKNLSNEPHRTTVIWLQKLVIQCNAIFIEILHFRVLATKSAAFSWRDEGKGHWKVSGVFAFGGTELAASEFGISRYSEKQEKHAF